MLALLALASATVATATYLPPSALAGRSGFSVELAHTPHGKRESSDGTVSAWALREKAKVDSRYKAAMPASLGRRDVTVTLADENLDASYSASVSIGTPAQTFDIILDTGSADLWVAGSECSTSSCTGITTFDPSSSSTFSNQTTAFDISYGSGDAAGYVAKDTVSLGGQSVTSQTFAVVTETDSGLINAPISGLMGLGFTALAQTRAAPWWVTESASWSDKVFAFKLARYRNVTTASATEKSGGTINFGSIDSSLYTGSINYVTTTAQTYWQIPVSGLSVGSTSVSVAITSSSSTGSSSSSTTPQAAIDTGTTLISVPTATAEALYAAISGSQAVTQSGYEGYYEFPCSSKVAVSINFGGVSYQISSADFNIGKLSANSNLCLGGIYGSDLGSSSSIQWIVGATFLKNVYSIYKYSGSTSGSQVGFAALSGGGTVTSGTASSTNTTSSSAATTSATSPGQSSDASRMVIPTVTCLVAVAFAVLI